MGATAWGVEPEKSFQPWVGGGSREATRGTVAPGVQKESALGLNTEASQAQPSTGLRSNSSWLKGQQVCSPSQGCRETHWHPCCSLSLSPHPGPPPAQQQPGRCTPCEAEQRASGRLWPGKKQNSCPCAGSKPAPGVEASLCWANK